MSTERKPAPVRFSTKGYWLLLFKQELRGLIAGNQSPVPIGLFYLLVGAVISITLGHAQLNDINYQQQNLFNVLLLWLVVLFGHTIGSSELFTTETSNGWLEQLIQQNGNLLSWVMVKLTWLVVVTAIPIIVILPVFAIWLNIEFDLLISMLMAFLLAHPGLCALALLAAGLRPANAHGILLPLLAFPLWLPFLFAGLLIVFAEEKILAVLLMSSLSLVSICGVPLLLRIVLTARIVH